MPTATPMLTCQRQTRCQLLRLRRQRRPRPPSPQAATCPRRQPLLPMAPCRPHQTQRPPSHLPQRLNAERLAPALTPPKHPPSPNTRYLMRTAPPPQDLRSQSQSTRRRRCPSPRPSPHPSQRWCQRRRHRRWMRRRHCRLPMRLQLSRVDLKRTDLALKRPHLRRIRRVQRGSQRWRGKWRPAPKAASAPYPPRHRAPPPPP